MKQDSDAFRIPPTSLGVYLWTQNIPASKVYTALDLSPPYFSQLLWGKRSSRQTCQRIAEYLNVPLAVIYDGPLKRGRPAGKKKADRDTRRKES
jgi:hypothetical protein